MWRDRDWFGIASELKVEHGRIALAVRLDVARRQQRYMRVAPAVGRAARRAARRPDGSVPTGPGAVAWCRVGDRHAIRRGAAVNAAVHWVQLTERLATATKLRLRPPTTLRTTLCDYQIEGHA